jgi:type IV secretory pathway VirB9-like protein
LRNFRSELAREELGSTAVIQNKRVAWAFFASKLAPTKKDAKKEALKKASFLLPGD